jgi:transposase
MRYQLADYEWMPSSPCWPNKPGNQIHDRRFLNGIFWVLRSGAPSHVSTAVRLLDSDNYCPGSRKCRTPAIFRMGIHLDYGPHQNKSIKWSMIA